MVDYEKQVSYVYTYVVLIKLQYNGFSTFYTE